jgi:hypothetical protein
MKRIHATAALLLAAVSTAAVADEAAREAAKARLAKKTAKARADAQAAYEKIVDAHMHARCGELRELLRGSGRHSRYMSRQQRVDVLYIRKAFGQYRPSWWPKTKSSGNVTFTARIWNRDFKANYVPSGAIGVQGVVGVRNGQLLVVVSWRPHLVDSPKAAKGDLAKLHKLTEGDIGEAIIWHELGHNYITRFLKPNEVIQLYMDYNVLFHQLQEFYADMTSIYHCSPPARKACMMIRLDALEANHLTDPHVRASNAVGALILAHVLAEPKQWPSFHLPGKVPEKDVERNTIIYLYEHLDPKYSLDEDRRLREMVWKFIMQRGESVLRMKGAVPLPNKLAFKLMPAEDREQQARRDAWVKARLEEAIKAGLTDKGEKGKEALETPLRIEIPWE